MAYYQFGVSKPEVFSLMFSSPRLHTTSEALQSYHVDVTEGTYPNGGESYE